MAGKDRGGNRVGRIWVRVVEGELRLETRIFKFLKLIHWLNVIFYFLAYRNERL